MEITRVVIWSLPIGMMILGAGVVCGQDYPSKPIRFVTSAAGGGGDFTSRLVAQGISPSLGQQIIVDNRPTGPIQGQIVSQAPPDGYTLAVSGSSVWTFSSLASVAPHMKTGRVRALAVTSALPSAMAPGLPTIAAAGVPGYEAVNMTVMFAPAKTPAAIVNRLSQEITRFVNQPDTKQKFFNAGVEAVGSSPEEAAVMVKSDIARMSKVIRDADIRAD